VSCRVVSRNTEGLYVSVNDDLMSGGVKCQTGFDQKSAVYKRPYSHHAETEEVCAG
jgi:hypothetical protein